MVKRTKINWAKECAPDKYQEYEAFLWGCFAHFYPGICRAPLHPKLLDEYLTGQWCANAGYVRIVSRDPDPKEIVRRLKQEHRLKREEIARTFGIAS